MNELVHDSITCRFPRLTLSYRNVANKTDPKGRELIAGKWIQRGYRAMPDIPYHLLEQRRRISAYSALYVFCLISPLPANQTDPRIQIGGYRFRYTRI